MESIIGKISTDMCSWFLTEKQEYSGLMSMTKWEYLRVTVIYSENDIIDSVNANDKELLHKVEHREWDAYLNKLGDEGWELVSVNMWNDGYDEVYYFKRRSPHPVT